MSNKKYWIETYGCQMNIAESDALILELEASGWIKAHTEAEAAAVIINTCTVRESADTRIWGRLGFFSSLKKSHDFVLVVIGCMAERLKEKIIERCKDVDIVVGTFSKGMLVDFLENGEPGAVLSDGESYHFSSSYSAKEGSQAMIPIMHGCNNFCTYCIVPYVRGREVSRDPQSIADEINSISGLKDVMLLGQNVNSYDFEYDGERLNFVGLLKFLIKNTTVPWVRFMSPHPKDFSQELIDFIAAEPRICRNIHLPLQHGSDRILKLMNRKYSVADYMEIVEQLREKVPGITLSTDLMIGFPGETQEDFDQTIELVKKIRFDDAFTYYYNKREGTKACDMEGHLSDELKKQRLAILIDVQREITVDKKKFNIGKVVLGLAESVSKKNQSEILARTESNHMVVFNSDEGCIGEFVKLRLVALSGNTYKGEVIK
ncbi:MAG: tRNA (N6-isopentenyl adenosine(37)-C2)-methylthiotransferase MiaB [Spirochaetales bacterium]|nr:tRNA (N6-isopentenyl adenosine(37)-C2)-methylthiotransferase MiaB [Spirochaetales bacterium]